MQECKLELLNLFQTLKSFSDIQLMVTLCLNRPFPNLKQLLEFIREQHGFIRILILSTERSPKEIVSCLQTKTKPIEEKLKNNEELNHVESMDVYALLELIQTETRNPLVVDDFFPVSMGAAMEPFLNLVGYGWFFIRPSPFCGFATCLVNTEKLYQSYPVTRLFDFSKLFLELKPILPRLQDGKIGLINATKLRKIFQNCVFPNKGELPDLYAHLTEKSKAEATRSFIQNLQFIIVHNNMDIAGLDAMRRCNCAIQTPSLNSSLSAYCTGCL